MRKKQGIALVTALVLMMVLVAVIAILSVDTLSEIRQNKNNLVNSRARNVAEAGATYAGYVLDTQLFSELKPIIDSYATSFVVGGNDPTTDYVIPQDAWDSVALQIKDALNANFSALPSSQLAGVGDASLSYDIRNFRIASVPTAGGGGQFQTYTAEYRVVATGTSGNNQRRIQEEGFLTIKVGRASLSQWLFLVEDAGGDRGFFPTGSVFDGPVHANSNWGFWGTPVFKGRITASDGGAWFWDIFNSCHDGLGVKEFLNAGSRPPCTEPVFEKGYDWNAPRVELPTNALSQERAALGLDPTEDNNGDGVPDPITNADRCAVLGISPCAGSNPIPDGVYLINDGTRVTGGIYIQGDVDELYIAAGGDGTQTYRITQAGRTWTIVVDYNTDTTQVTDPLGNVTNLLGVPNGPAPLGTGGPTGQIYVNGNVDALRAPSRTGPVPTDSPDHPPPATIPPALSLETQLNVTAVGGIGLFTDLVYECDPTQMTNSSYLATHPRCASASGPLRTVLGVFSETDDITIRVGAVDDIYLWGSYLSAATGKGLAVENYNTRGPQGKMRLFGGLIQWEDQLRGVIGAGGNVTSGYLETFEYDRRFENSRLTPPNFPTTRVFQLADVGVTRLTYKEY
ncbi:DUF4900 domain-containing protein [Oceanithermus desulfurans]